MENKYVFSDLNQGFQDIKKELLSKKEYSSYELGTVFSSYGFKGDIAVYSYIFFVDKHIYRIFTNMKLETYTIADIEFSRRPTPVNETNKFRLIPHKENTNKYADTMEIAYTVPATQRRLFLEDGMKSNIESYLNSYAEYEKHLQEYEEQLKEEAFKKFEIKFWSDVEQFKNKINNSNHKLLFENFFKRYVEEHFINIEWLHYVEEDLLDKIFNRKNQARSWTKPSIGNLSQLKPFENFIELLLNKKIIQNSDIEGYNDYLIIYILKSMAIEHFSSYFKELYGGFFPNVELLKFDSLLDVYFEIDLLDQKDIKNINYLTYYLFRYNKNFSQNLLYNTFSLINEKVIEYQHNLNLSNFEKQLLQFNQDKVDKNSENSFNNIAIDDVDMMTGVEFENFIAYLFKKMGYSVSITQASSDQGIDIIATKNGIQLGIQVKRYSSSVSNKAIQEVVAGIHYYQLQKSVVITNNYFTSSAIELGKMNDVIMWDRNILKEKIDEYIRL